MTESPKKSSRLRPGFTPDAFNARGPGTLPGLIGLEILEVSEARVVSRLMLRPELLAPNGYLHAAVVVALADTSAGYGTIAHLPEGARGFTTIELKTNFFGTLLEGELACEASAIHMGRTTQVWDAVVSDAANGRKLALFRCSQMVLWPNPAKS
jgi:uncharacterized protein (TIGR00369 family)